MDRAICWLRPSDWARTFGLIAAVAGLVTILARVPFLSVFLPVIFPSLSGGIGNVLCGTSLVASASRKSSRYYEHLTAGAAIASLTLSLLTILLHLLGKIDIQTSQGVYMPLGTAVAFSLLSLGLLALALNGRGAIVAQVFAIGGLALCMMVLIGYAYGAAELTSIGPPVPVALPNAVTISLMSIGVLLVRQDIGVVKRLLRPTPGGFVLRRSSLPLILIPLFLIWLTYATDFIELFGSHVGLAIMTFAVVIVLVAFAWKLADTLDKANLKRLEYEEERARSESYLRDLVDTVSDHAIYRIDAQGLVTTWNVGAERTHGYASDEVVGQSHERFFTQPDIDAGLPARLLRQAADEGQAEAEHWSLRKDSSLLYVRDAVTPLRKNGDIAGFTKVTHDISSQKRSLEEKAMMGSILETVFDPVIVIDEAGTIERVNPATEKVFGYQSDEMIGKNVSILMASPHRERHDDYVKRYIETGERHIIGLTRELTAQRKNGAVFPIELQVSEMLVGDRRKFTGVVRDISERKALEAKMIRMAQHDTLTGLPNRALSYEFGEKLLTAARRNKSECAVFFVDLDRFKAINDTFGHEAGDAVLREVAERLNSVVRSEDMVGRLGGDEFLVVLSHVHKHHGIRRVAASCLATLAQSYRYGDVELETSPSIGISLFPADGTNMEELVKSADAAMYHAKQRGRNNFQFYSAEMNSPMAAALLLDRQLREAIEQESFTLHYQPIVDAETLRTDMVEALVRWPGNEAHPCEFVSVAESNGVIYRLGEWVLHAAACQLRVWKDKGLDVPSMSINISPLQLRKPDFVQVVIRTIRQCNLDPDDLRLEITEALRPKQVKEIAPILHALKELGVRISLDGLGRDYSDLYYIQALPIDAVKINREMLVDALDNPAQAAFVNAIIGLTNEMQLTSIAEGIETEPMLDFVRSKNCRFVQGHLIAQSMSTEDFEEWHLARTVFPASSRNVIHPNAPGAGFPSRLS